MSEFANGKVSPWGYIIDAQNLPDFINSSEFNMFTGRKFTGDTRVEANIPSATASIRNYCGWHIAPELHCGMWYAIKDLRDAYVGGDLLVQLPATFVTSVVKVLIDATYDPTTKEYSGEEWTDYDIDSNGLLRLYDVGLRDRRAKLFIHYVAGHPMTDISVIKELTANKITHAVTNTYGVNSEAAGGVSVSYNSSWTGKGSTALTDDTREVLNAYKVKGVF